MDIGKITINDIILKDIKARKSDFEIDYDKEVGVKFGTKIDFSDLNELKSNNEIIVKATLELEQSELKEEENYENFIEVMLVYSVKLQMDEEEKVILSDEDEEEISRKVSQFVFPFAKEIISNITSRMGIPAVQLPLRLRLGD